LFASGWRRTDLNGLPFLGLLLQLDIERYGYQFEFTMFLLFESSCLPYQIVESFDESGDGGIRCPT